GTGATRRMFMSSLLRVLFMLFCLGLMVFVGGMIGSGIFWASQRPPDPLEPLTSSEGAAIGFGWMAAVMLGAAAGFLPGLIIGVVGLSVWEYRRGKIEDDDEDLSIIGRRYRLK